jgi:pyruvate kinase
MTANEKCYHQLACVWGVVPFLKDGCKSVVEAFSAISEFALQKGIVAYGDLVVVTAGAPFGVPGTTNMMIVESIGEVLVRGNNGVGQPVYGNIVHLLSPESCQPYSVRDKLLVIATCDESYFPFIREASGVILQNLVNDTESERFLLEAAQQYNKPVLMRADTAYRVLKEGQLMTLDPQKNLVYKGVVV